MTAMRVIPSAPDYAVTACGRVFRVTKGRPGYPVPYELKQHLGKRGYYTVGLYRRTTPVHLLVAEVFLPPDPSRPEVAHNDGNKLNNDCWNLRRATRKENNTDRFGHGTVLRGTEIRSAKLTPGAVRSIRDLRKTGVLQREIAEEFGVSRRAVGKLLNRETWCHV